MRLFHDQLFWVHVSCTDPRCLEIFKRHYSYNPLRKNVARFVGPGEEITLLSTNGKALFVWRKERFRGDDQTGINCSVFRNEGDDVSSLLILEAEEIAWRRWPGERLFTFVNAKKVKSDNPGYCFKMAGWKLCGESKKRKLVILEKIKSTIMADPKANTPSDKPKKTRVRKPKPTNYDQALAVAQGLNLEDKANLVKELKKHLFSEGAMLESKAKHASELLQGI